MSKVRYKRNTDTGTSSPLKKAVLPKALSVGEETFHLHCQARLHPVNQPVREFVFHPKRLWRIDFAWPERKLAVEIDSSVHRIKARFASDIEKHNALNMAGWTLLRYTARMVKAGTAIEDVEAALRR